MPVLARPLSGPMTRSVAPSGGLRCRCTRAGIRSPKIKLGHPEGLHMSDLATYQNWIEPGFDWLDENWSDGETWQAVRPGFLAHLQVTEADLATPECRVLGIVVHELDGFNDDVERRAAVGEIERTALVSRAFTEWQQEPDAAPAPGGGGAAPAANAAPAEPQWVEGHGWMVYDEASGQWAAAEP